MTLGLPGPAEETIACAWERVLARRPASVDDDFFALGGNSVDAARMLAVLEDAFETDLETSPRPSPLTVATLAALVHARSADMQRTGTPDNCAPIAFPQAPLLWHEALVPGSFNVPPPLRRLEGPVDVAVLERAFSELVRRHEALRTTFRIAHGRGVQVVGEARGISVPVLDLSHLFGDHQDRAVAKAVERLALEPFDLRHGPLFEPHLLRLEAQSHILVIRTHHIVWDDLSVGVFIREISALYSAFLAGEPSPLAEPPAQFSDFARDRRRRLAGPAGNATLAYWREQLAGAPLAVQLPIGDPRRPAGAPHPPGEPLAWPLPTSLTEGLREVARRGRATLFMTLLAAFEVLVARYTGHDDVVLSTVGANRGRTEYEGLIGSFAHKLPLRVRLSGDPGFMEVIGRVRRAVLEGLSHQGLPFDTIVRGDRERQAADHGLAPSVNVMFQGLAHQRRDLRLPGVAASGVRVPVKHVHFTSGDRRPDHEPVWGAGLYLGTFLGISVLETDGDVVLRTRGAYDTSAVERLLRRYVTLLEDVVADPTRPVSALGELQGRVDDQLDLRGFRVDRAMMEAALGRCAGVSDVAVALLHRPDGARLVAYVAPEGTAPTLERLRTVLWSTLPGYAWPAAMAVVDRIPRSITGEVDTVALPEPTQAPTAPTTRHYEILAAGWADALGVDEVGPDDNYWQDLSFLQALEVAREAGLHVDTKHVTRNRTLRTLATALAAEELATSSYPWKPRGGALRRPPWTESR